MKKIKLFLFSFFCICVGAESRTSTDFNETILYQHNNVAITPSEQEMKNNVQIAHEDSATSRQDILIIGDSNIEYDYMTRPLKQELGITPGKGYRSFSLVLGAMASASGLSFSTSQLGAGKWQARDMNNSSETFVNSPTGLLVYTSDAGATLTFGFSDTSVDIYYLTESNGGSFDVYVDNVEKTNVNTTNTIKVTKKVSLIDLGAGAHTLKIVATGDGQVSVCGVDVGAADQNRIAVHNWGNEGVTADQFVNKISNSVFSSALQELEPTYIIILIGTNDASFTSVSTFKANLQSMVTRVKTALPNVPILIMSPLPVKYGSTYDTAIQTQYREQAYSQVAANSNVDYWDMYAFWGPFDDLRTKSWRLNDLHWNLTGGTAVAKQLVIQMGRTPLRKLYDAHKNTAKGYYTDFSWNAFITAKNNAKAILNGYETTQTAMTDAQNALLSAVANLTISYPGFCETILPQLNNSVIDIPKGTYAFDLDNPDQLIKFTGKKDVQINGNGSTIICSKPGGVFRFESCENITVSGFTFDCYPRTSTQGTITKISEDYRTLEVEIHKGYAMINPNDEASRACILLYDKENRELIRNFHTAAAEGAIIVDSAARKVTFNINGPKAGVYKVGDYVTFSSFPNGYGGHLFQSDYCKNMEFRNITVHDTRGATFLEHHCSNNHYYRCVVDRKLNDPLYEEDQLRTTAGDIVHSLFATKGPKIEECTFKHMCDDGVNITGFFYTMYKVSEARKRIYLLISGDTWWLFSLQVGDSIVCIGNDGSIKGKAKITAIDKPTEEPTPTEIKTCTDKLGNMKSKEALKYGMSIQLDEWVAGLEIGGMVYPEDRVGNGFEIINCVMGHNRSRSALVKASNGIIKGNIFQGAALPGLVLAPEYYWMEAGISHNVEITDNLIEDCMFDSDQRNSGQLAALTVVSETPRGGLTQTPVFENIVIHRNTIRGCPRPCVFLNAVASGYYYENMVEPDENMVRLHGYNLGVTNRSEYAEKYVGNIIKDQDPLLSGIVSASKENDLIRIDANGNVTYTESNFGNKCRLTIYNTLGKNVLYDEFEKTSSVSLNSLSKGFYIVNLKCDNKSYSRKYVLK